MAKALTAQSVERLRPDPSRRLEIADALLPGLYFVVQPSGARSWAVRYRYGGKPRKLTLGTYPVLELGTARERAREALQGVGVGRDPASEKQEAIRAAKSGVPDRDTVAAVAEAFLSRHVRPKLRASTAEHAERTLAKYIVPAWGERRIQEITRRDVIALLDGIVDSGKPIAANRVLAITRRLFNWAIDRSIIENSPCTRVARPSVEKSRDRVLTDYELRLVWMAAERRGWTSGPLLQP